MPARRNDGWQLSGAADRAPRVVRSLHLLPEDLEAHNRRLQAKFASIAEREIRWAGENLEDAHIAIVANGTAARVARTAIDRGRDQGLRAGLFRPITLWPFPSSQLAGLAPALRAILVVEMSAGQMVEDVRLAVEGQAPVFFDGRMGGMVPTPGEVVDALNRAWALTAPKLRPSETNDASADEEPDPLSLIELGAQAGLGPPRLTPTLGR
jgi:2-oxoglutarate ferredoxin oxidoreductase subunit alpha